MRVELRELIAGLDCDTEQLRALAAARLGLDAAALGELRILRRAADARRGRVRFVFSVAVELPDDSVLPESGWRPYEPYVPPKPALLREKPRTRPVVCGAGPAGLFAALTLARAGAEPILLERGAPVEQRARDVERFIRSRRLDPESNIQFGEGGAGAFSDGKLSTGVGGPLARAVLHILWEHGAPEEILWQSHPHIGTDRLPAVVRALREEILSLGGEVRFGTRLVSLETRGGALCAVGTEQAGRTEELPAEALILAAGHSARDVYAMLYEKGVVLLQKPFSIGVRAEHRQRLIDRAQYGASAGHPALGAAEYRLVCHLPTGRTVYSFCMCPGGELTAAASEEGGVVTNGMSRFARDGRNANAAILVSVTPADFGSLHPLAGIEYQRRWERAAFRLGGGDHRAPAQYLGDLMAGRASSEERRPRGAVRGTYPLGLCYTALDDCLPEYVTASLRAAFPVFGRRLRGFDEPGTLLTGVETRSSSPVRILRDPETLEAPCLRGLYPCGEGAGQAGGIVSAAIDGIRAAGALAGRM